MRVHLRRIGPREANRYHPEGWWLWVPHESGWGDRMQGPYLTRAVARAVKKQIEAHPQYHPSKEA